MRDSNADLNALTETWLTVDDTAASLSPVHTYADIFENGVFFLCFGKNSHPHVAYSNRFSPSTRKRKNGGNMIAPDMEHARRLVI